MQRRLTGNVSQHRNAKSAAALLAAAAMLSIVLSIGGCATATRKSANALAAGQPTIAVAADHDVMLKLLAAQFALQGNDLKTGAQGFAEAASLSADPAIAEEAVHLAIAVKDWALAKQTLARWQQLAPAAPGVLQARAWIAFGEKRDDAAYADLDTLAKRGSDDAWRLVAQTLFGAPDKTAAARVLDRLATPAYLGDKETNWVAVSQLAFKLGDKTLSQKLADAAIMRFHGGESYAWSARLALDRGDKDASRRLFAEALRRDPRSLSLRAGYAALLSEAGDNAAAARELAKGPQDDTTYAARAAYAARADDKPTLSALYAQIESDKSARDDKRTFLLGQLAELLGKREAALQWYRVVSDDDDHWFDAQMRQAVLFDQVGKTAQAIDFLHQLQTRSADDADQLDNAYLLEAELQLHAGRAREAIAVYTRALAQSPDDARMLYGRALVAADHGEQAVAEKDLRHVLSLKPDDADAMNALGYTLADKSMKGDPKIAEARDLIRRAITLKPNEPAIIDSLGWVHYRMGELDAALVQLRRAYAKQPDADIAAHLGEVLWVKGEHDEAQQVWSAGRKKDPKNKALLETIQRLTT